MTERATPRLAASLRALSAVFRNRDLGRLQVAWGGIMFSTWSYAIALGVYAFEVAGPTAVGVVALVRLLPGALASPFAGLIGDRYSRRTVVLASSLTSAAVLAVSALAAAADAPAAFVFVLAGAFTVASSPYVPAEGALLPLIARTPQELAAANVTHSATDNLGFLTGAVLTGVLLATASPQAVFAVAAVVPVGVAVLLAGVQRDERPAYAKEARLTNVVEQTAQGFRTLIAEPPLRLIGGALTLVVLFEGAADVLAVLVALDLLGLGSGSVGYLNAGWGVGALAGSAALAVLLDRGKLAAGLVAGSLAIGAATAFPAAWPVPAAAYVAWLGMGFGYTIVEVVARTLQQRLCSDEVLARVYGSLETARLGAMALGAIGGTGLAALLGTRGALLALAALLPAFVVLRWGPLRSFEMGVPVEERAYSLLRGDPIFEPLPVAILERLSHDLILVEVGSGEEIISQGGLGDRFYLIDRGEVAVFKDGVRRGTQGPGESFGEIALVRDLPRTATVRATEPVRLLTLQRDRFITAVTGHLRSSEAAQAVAEARL